MTGKNSAPTGKPEGNEKTERRVNGDCRHHWIIESPKGPTSCGVCKYCGLRKVFENYVPVSSWGEDSSLPMQRRRTQKSGSGDEKTEGRAN